MVPVHRDNPKKLFYGLLILFILFVAETGMRAAFSLKWKINFFRPLEVIALYYPATHEAMIAEPGPTADTFDVVLFGASALNPLFGRVQEDLEKELAHCPQLREKKFKVWNLSQPGHTSMDVKNKVKLIEDKDFDLAIFYEGINDARTNNIPTQYFDPQYRHYHWYEDANTAVEFAPSLKYFALPYGVVHAFNKLRHFVSRNQRLPQGTPPEEWKKYGSEIKSKKTYYNNMKYALDWAQEKQISIVYPEYVHHIPKPTEKNYQMIMDGIATWGDVENVEKAIHAHNAVLREFQSMYPNIVSLKTTDLIPNEGEYFSSVCHFTPEGSDIFARMLMISIEKAMQWGNSRRDSLQTF